MEPTTPTRAQSEERVAPGAPVKRPRPEEEGAEEGGSGIPLCMRSEAAASLRRLTECRSTPTEPFLSQGSVNARTERMDASPEPEAQQAESQESQQEESQQAEPQQAEDYRVPPRRDEGYVAPDYQVLFPEMDERALGQLQGVGQKLEELNACMFVPGARKVWEKVKCVRENLFLFVLYGNLPKVLDQTLRAAKDFAETNKENLPAGTLEKVDKLFGYVECLHSLVLASMVLDSRDKPLLPGTILGCFDHLHCLRKCVVVDEPCEDGHFPVVVLGGEHWNVRGLRSLNRGDYWKTWVSVGADSITGEETRALYVAYARRETASALGQPTEEAHAQFLAAVSGFVGADGESPAGVQRLNRKAAHGALPPFECAPDWSREVKEAVEAFAVERGFAGKS